MTHRNVEGRTQVFPIPTQEGNAFQLWVLHAGWTEHHLPTEGQEESDCVSPT